MPYGVRFKTALDREAHFWSKVRKTESCWIWTGYKHHWTGGLGNEYGQTSWFNVSVSTHRLAYALLRGAIPHGMELDHLCRNRACCNPWHLEPVTHKENLRRGIYRWNLTHCPAGHAYEERNTYRTPRGHRRCRKCRAIQEKKRRRILKLAEEQKSKEVSDGNNSTAVCL